MIVLAMQPTVVRHRVEAMGHKAGCAWKTSSAILVMYLAMICSAVSLVAADKAVRQADAAAICALS